MSITTRIGIITGEKSSFFPRLLNFVRSRRLGLALTIFLGWAGGLLIVVQAWIISRIVDGVFLKGGTLPAMMPALGTLLLVIGLRAAAAGGMEVSADWLSLKIKSDLRARLMHHLQELGPAYTRAESTGELATSAVEGVEALDGIFTRFLPQAALAACIPLTVLLVVFPIDPLTGIVFLLTAPLLPLFMILIGKGAEILTRRQFQTLGHLSAALLDSLQGLTTLKLLGQSRMQEEVIREKGGRFRDVTLGVLRYTFLSALVLELLATISTALVAVEIGLRLLQGGMAFQQAFFILILAPDFYQPLRSLGTCFHAGMSGLTAARRIFEIMYAPVPSGTKPIPLSLPETAGKRSAADSRRSRYEITFQDVSFFYPLRNLPALEDLDFTIPHGRTTALVGATGSGKSTVAALLLRFIEPVSGRILVAGAPLEDIPAGDWRRDIAWVPQTPYLFNDTLEANLRLAKPRATHDELSRAIELARLDAFVSSLPNGLKTMIGERGERLSGGQAQRLAIARAFLRDAPFLIMDEPTSGLDPSLEGQLQGSVRQLMRGRTTLVSAHRLNTIRGADQILVMDQGRLVECGTHDTLIAYGGLYARLLSVR